MKKTIIVSLIVMILLNLICVESFAADSDSQPEYPSQFDSTPQENGEATVKNADGKETSASILGTTYSGSTVFKVVANAITVVPQAINQVIELFVESTSKDETSRFTIYETVLGQYEIFNINYLDIPENINEDTSLMGIIKYNVIKYYRVMRNLSIAISLFVLIYIGIRMAISTVASDKAKYKKMFGDWIASLVLVFFMHFLIIIISYLMQKGLEIVNNVAEAWNFSGFEKDMYSGAISNFTKAKGYNIFMEVLIITILTYYQLKFFIYYLRRTLEVNFLVIVSPLVTITYSIDKAGDGKAQAFEAFLKELITKSAIQLIHAVLYVVFIASAGVIAVNNPLLAVLFFGILSRTEKITRKIFAVDDDGFEKTKVPLAD